MRKTRFMEQNRCCHQFKSLYYPREHYPLKMESEQTELRIRAKEEYRREHPNPNLEFSGEIVSGAAQGAIEGASQAAAGGDGTAAEAGGGASSGGGCGSISGPFSLAPGRYDFIETGSLVPPKAATAATRPVD